MAQQHVATCEAYERKDGGYRGVAINVLSREKFSGPVRETIEEAKFDVKHWLESQFDWSTLRPGYYRLKSGWKCNYFRYQ